MTAALLFTAIYVPIRAAFDTADSTFFLVLDELVNLFFYVDIVINFISAFEDDQYFVETNLK